MFKRFSNNLTVSQINKVFRHAKFPKRTLCIFCNSREISVLSDDRYLCRRCNRKFSLLTNTGLSNIRLPLDQLYEILYWFVYEFTANKAAKEIQINQKIVHRCFSSIRKSITDYEEAVIGKFIGKNEVDETYVGPKFKNRRKRNKDKIRKVNVIKRGRGAKNLLQIVFGIYQRNGTVYIEFVDDAGKKTLQDIIKSRITLESEIYSDTWTAYQGLRQKGYKHKTIDHGKEIYVRQSGKDKIHINGIEGFWGYLKEHLLKHHGVSKNNLLYYVKEQEFRFNNRHLSTDEMIQKLIEILMNFTPPND